MRSTQEAALGSEARWLRHLFSYADTRVLVALFLATQILDTLTTAYAVGTGQFSEANPLFGHLVNADPLIAYGSKLLVAVLVLGVVLLMRLKWWIRRRVLTIFVVMSLVAPVANVLRVTGHL